MMQPHPIIFQFLRVSKVLFSRRRGRDGVTKCDIYSTFYKKFIVKV